MSAPVISQPTANGTARPSADEAEERAVDEAHAGSSTRSRRVALALGAAVVGDEPADVRVQRPRSAPSMPAPRPTCGLCGSPSSSVCAWCLRWSATQLMTGPWTAIEPGGGEAGTRPASDVRNARCVSIRWKPTVTPKPVIRYITSSSARSCRPTTSFQKTTIAAAMTTGGRTTASRFTTRAVFDMS